VGRYLISGAIVGAKTSAGKSTHSPDKPPGPGIRGESSIAGPELFTRDTNAEKREIGQMDRLDRIDEGVDWAS
jgi:hypothetical protein